MESSAGSLTARRPLGYGLLVLITLAIGAVGTIPFVMLLYTVGQLVLAPLGLAAADSSNNDGIMVLIVAGVLLPLTIVTVWAWVVWWLTARFALARRLSWPLAALALALPLVLFVLAKY